MCVLWKKCRKIAFFDPWYGWKSAGHTRACRTRPCTRSSTKTRTCRTSLWINVSMELHKRWKIHMNNSYCGYILITLLIQYVKITNELYLIHFNTVIICNHQFINNMNPLYLMVFHHGNQQLNCFNDQLWCCLLHLSCQDGIQLLLDTLLGHGLPGLPVSKSWSFWGANDLYCYWMPCQLCCSRHGS